MLLYIQERALQLDRKLLSLLFTASLSSACIIPAGPEFQDPPGELNAPAYFSAVSPDQGTTVTAEAPTFSVTPTDTNVGDNLWVQWSFEFPPFDDANTVVLPAVPIPHSDDGSQLRKPEIFQPDCGQLNRAVSTHQITAAVSDSEFIGGQQPVVTKNGARPFQVTWTWIKNCQGQGTSP